ncbi:MAG: PilZ domain-containing protein [Chitinispirillaceae bacterium]
MERRQHIRIDKDTFKVEIRVKSRLPQETNDFNQGIVLDLSEGGMLFTAHENRESGTQVILSFALPDSGIKMISEALIIHSRKEKDEFRLGAQFKNLGLAERTLLRKCIQTYTSA